MSNSRPELIALIIATSAYYGQKLEDLVVQMYADDLSDLPLEQVRAAIAQLRRDPKINRFPLPATIRDRIHPADTLEADAREAASRIIQCVSSCGPYQPLEARSRIGSLGWYVVERMGGWWNVCEMLTYDNMAGLQAQWRELAISAYKRAQMGTLNIPPSLPEPHPMDTPTMKIFPKSPEQRQLEKLELQLEELKRQEEKV